MTRILFSLIIMCCFFDCHVAPKSESEADAPKTFHQFISEIPFVRVPLHLEIGQNFTDDFNNSDVRDSIWFHHLERVVGLLPDTQNYYAILYIAFGDDPYPCVKIFSKQGDLISNNVIAYTDCAGTDCTLDSCRSFVKIERSGVTRHLSYVQYECDSNDRRKFVKRYSLGEKISFDRNGKMIAEVIQ